MYEEYYPFVNIPLPYAYNALEPYIDEKTMRLHHDKHLQTYINNLNAVLKDNPQLQELTLEELLVDVPNLSEELQTPIRNNAGGVYNHEFYFEGMLTTKTEPHGELAPAINKQYGSTAGFIEEFKKAALSVFGSGYAWLVYDNGALKIITTPNQNSPIEQNLCPILAIDVWEHAYYLKHYNVRVDYIDDWFKVVNWEKANEKYLMCKGNR